MTKQPSMEGSSEQPPKKGHKGKTYSGGFYTGGQPDEKPPMGADAGGTGQQPHSSQPQENEGQELAPRVEQWYLRQDTGELFMVTDFDETTGTVEIQTASGELDELDIDAWEALTLVLAEPSRDWTRVIDSDLAEDEASSADRNEARGKEMP